MSDLEHAVELIEKLVERLAEQEEMLERMLTIIEGHVGRFERLEYHVFKTQPPPRMRTARLDH